MTSLLVILAPVFIVLELAQLLVAERFIGVRQIRANRHPLDEYPEGKPWITAAWLAYFVAVWCYLFALALNPLTSIQGVVLLLVGILGFAFRRIAGLKWALVVMTIEGAIRMGLWVNILVGWFFFDGRINWWRI